MFMSYLRKSALRESEPKFPNDNHQVHPLLRPYPPFSAVAALAGSKGFSLPRTLKFGRRQSALKCY